MGDREIGRNISGRETLSSARMGDEAVRLREQGANVDISVVR
jgi:Pyruvate/2-oxoacid:ferredoxin oxidoreductase gamma subunit